MTTREPPLRADARRNRDAVLAAARMVFAEHGLDAPIDLIAREAGVGRATLYRRFPTRDDLIRAIFNDNFAALEQIAAGMRDYDDAYLALLAATAELLHEDRGFIDLVARRPPSREIARDIASRYLAIVAEPLRRAQAAGIVRRDVDVEDTLLFVDMIAGAAMGATAAGRSRPRPEAHRDALDVIVDAVAPGRPTR